MIVHNRGVPIVFDDIGVGTPAVVLVHGWSCDRGYWSGQVPALRRHHRVVNIDLAGHGESGRGRQDWSMAAFASDVATVVEQLGLMDFVLVGHSSGGNVSLETARLWPQRVRALVWADSYRRFGAHLTADQVEQRLSPYRGRFADETRRFVRGLFGADADVALAERVANGMSSAPPDVAVPALAATWHYERTAAAMVRALGRPIIAINPGDGSSDAASLQSCGVRLLTLPHSGHFLMLDDPQGFNVLLLQALQELAA